METIFDFEPTEREINALAVVDYLTNESPAEYLEFSSEDKKYFDLGLLFMLRKEGKKGSAYYEKVRDPELRKTWLCSLETVEDNYFNC
jgi:hypothetical protein